MPVFNNPLAGAAGQTGGADAGYQIERSLRFNRPDSAYLSRSPSGGNRKKWTLSFWYKPCVPSSNTRHCIIEARNASSYHSVINFRGDNKFEIYHYTTGLVFHVLTTGIFRDPSAWYHFVVAYDTDQTGADKVKIFCNGVRLTEFDTASYPSDSYGDALWSDNNTPHTIGRHDSQYLDAYLAEFYWLDGIAPGIATDDASGSVTGTPSAQYLTDFGEFDTSTGRWNPIEYTGSYGNQGYYLKFADTTSNAALGTDSSGNNNTWNVNNLYAANTAGGAPTVQGGGPGFPAENTAVANLWDGATANYPGDFVTAADGGEITVTWPTPIQCSVVEYYSYNGNDRANVNNGTWINSGANGGWKTAYNSSPIALVTLKMQKADQASYVKIGAIRIDGTVLTTSNYQSPDAGTDSLIDSPTDYDDGTNIGGNYCVLNPLTSTGGNTGTSNGILSEGNLKLTGPSSSTWSVETGTIGVKSGKWYYEVHPDNGVTGSLVGWADPQEINYNDAVGNTARSYGYYATGNVRNSNNNTGFGASYSDGDVIGCAIDIDNQKIYWSKNGQWQNSADLAAGTGSIYTIQDPVANGFFYTPAVSTYDASSSLECNFGQRSFTYPPGGTGGPPSDYKALCTTNFDNPPIANGRNHFDTQIWSGTNTNAAVSVTGFKFSPEFIWAKSRSHAYSNNLYDIVRGTGKGLYSDTNGTEVTNNQYGYISQFNSDGFTASAGSSDNDFFNGTGKTYVAFGWEAGGTNTPISAGSLNSSFYDQSKTWSNSLTSTQTFNLAESRAFDGNLSNLAATANATDANILFTETFYNVTKLRVYMDHATSYRVRINGGTWHSDSSLGASSNASWRDLTSIIPANGTVNSIESDTNGQNNGVNWSAVEVNGRLLIDSGVSVTNVPSNASSARANTTAGFSIVTWTASSAGDTIGHGLGKKPDMIIAKSRTVNSQPWVVYHSSLGKGSVLILDEVAGNNTTYSTYWGNNEPDSSVFGTYTGQIPWANNAGDMVAYCFSEIEGYSRFGKYVGNSSASGQFIHTGFKPAWIMVKKITNTDANSGWHIYDAERDPYNRVENWVLAESAFYENRAANNTADMGGTYNWDFYSNGFRAVHSSNNLNETNSQYIYAAFASSPFKHSRAR